MTIGEKLLELAAEYQNLKEAQIFDPSAMPSGRTRAEIGAEYEQTIRELLVVRAEA